MRKLYALLAWFVLILASLQTKAQNETADFNFVISGNNVHFTNTSNTNANDTSLRKCYWQFGDGTGLLTHYNTNPYHTYLQPGTYQVCMKLLRRVVPTTTNGDTLILVSGICKSIVIIEPDSCTAKFESLLTSPTVLGKYFVAHPWHNHNKKPLLICWTFGDGKDTCIKYSTALTSNYAVYHLYAQSGVYNVCVKILYDGGCESHSCQEVKVGEAVSCSADFQRLPLTSSTSSLYAGFQALTWNSLNNKPALICWTFGDGRDTCIQYSNTFPGPYTVYHKYAHEGSYEVCIKILYNGGCEAKKCKVIE